MYRETICSTEYACTVASCKCIEDYTHFKWKPFIINDFYFLEFQLIRKYEIGWSGVDYLDIKTTTTINKPEHPVHLTFKKRSI